MRIYIPIFYDEVHLLNYIVFHKYFACSFRKNPTDEQSMWVEKKQECMRNLHKGNGVLDMCRYVLTHSPSHSLMNQLTTSIVLVCRRALIRQTKDMY